MNTGNNEEIKYYTIGEVSEITKIKQTVLRFWETEFDLLKPVKNKFGHRVYSIDDIAIIEKIKDLLYKKGLTIKGAKNYFMQFQNASDEDNKSSEMFLIKKDLLEILSLLKDKK